MKVKLEDFEKYRNKLINHAIYIMVQKGSFNQKIEECSDIAKDIVQDCYLIFNRRYGKDNINDEKHLLSYLKLLTYYSYKRYFDIIKNKHMNIIFNSKEFTSDYSEILIENDYDKVNYIDEFINCLTPFEKSVLELKIKGFNNREIGKNFKISRQAIDKYHGKIKDKYKKYESANNKMLQS